MPSDAIRCHQPNIGKALDTSDGRMCTPHQARAFHLYLRCVVCQNATHYHTHILGLCAWLRLGISHMSTHSRACPSDICARTCALHVWQLPSGGLPVGQPWAPTRSPRRAGCGWHTAPLQCRSRGRAHSPAWQGPKDDSEPNPYMALWYLRGGGGALKKKLVEKTIGVRKLVVLVKKR